MISAAEISELLHHIDDTFPSCDEKFSPHHRNKKADLIPPELLEDFCVVHAPPLLYAPAVKHLPSKLDDHFMPEEAQIPLSFDSSDVRMVDFLQPISL